MASTLFSPGTVYTSAWGNETDKATHNYLSAVAGTNTITATGPVSSIGYVAGDRYFFVPANTNSGAVTININSLGAKNVTKYGTTPLVANDLITGEIFQVVYDGVQFQLMNPKTIDVASTGRFIGVQAFIANGTYTPTAGTTSIIVECIGAGGAGGGAVVTAGGQVSGGAGGGGGAYSKARFTSGFSSVALTCGSGGVPVLGSTGGAGGATSFGALLTAPGGGGGGFSPATAGAIVLSGGVGGGPGSVSGGQAIVLASGSAAPGWTSASPTVTFGPPGAGGPLTNSDGPIVGGNTNGVAGLSGVLGAGGSGCCNAPAQAVQRQGGAGGVGGIFVYEYS